MSLNDTKSNMESIPQEALEGLTQAQLIKVIRALENFHKGRKVLGHLVCASIACVSLPFLFVKLGVFGFGLAPFIGLFVLYVMDQTTVTILNWKKKK